MEAQSVVVPKKQSSLPLIILIILLIFSLASSAFLFYQNRQLYGLISNLTTPTPRSPIPTLQPSEAPAQEATTGWQSYTNQQYAFSINYPPTFIVSDNLPKTSAEWRPNKVLSISSTTLPGNPSLIVEVNADGYGPIFYSHQYEVQFAHNKLTIVKTEPIDYSQNPSLQPSNFHATTNTIEQNHNRYHFQLSASTVNETQAIQQLNEILSTFKFTQ